MRRKAIFRRASKLAWSAPAVLGIVIRPYPAFAEGHHAVASAQVDVGTLPLLAALGIGIIVAIVAAVAFLQLAAKGKDMRDSVSGADEDDDSREVREDEDWRESAAATDKLEDDPLTDYTIPVTTVLEKPDAAEPAHGDEPRLCGIEGQHAGACFRLLDRRLSIGRDPSQCGVVFPYETAEVSRRHCTLRFNKDSRMFLLVDHGSANGTYLSNGERLQPGRVYELRAGERFSLSGTHHWFEVRDSDPA